MRRLRHHLFAVTAAIGLIHAAPSFAQFSTGAGGGGGRAGDDQSDDSAQSKKRKEDFGAGPSLMLKNAGPCPFVKSLYDAGRYLEFKDNVEASANVAYTGEIETISSACAYNGGQPIQVHMQVLFELGRGPQARDSHKTYRYWVAVTDRNHGVLDKEFFDLPVAFPAGKDRVNIVETLNGISIPRANSKVSGANFEILIGFDVTPQMADFNRQGKRFKADAGQTEAAARISPAQP